MRNFVPKQLRYRLEYAGWEMWTMTDRFRFDCTRADYIFMRLRRLHGAQALRKRASDRKVRFGTGRCPFPWREKACLFNASRNTEIVRVSGWYACEQPVLENRLSSSRLSLGRTKFVSGNEIPKLLYFNGGCTETPVRFRATRSSSSLEEISGRRNSGSVSKVKRFPGWKAHISKEMKRFMEI